MQKSQSVMGDLYKIKEQIAGGATEQYSAAPEQTPPQKTAEQPSAPGLAPELLKRRYSEFLRLRNDLLERINTMAGMLQQEADGYNARLEVLQRTADELNRIQQELPAEEPGKDAFSSRSELADITLLTERLRIEILRLTPVVESGASDPARSTSEGSGLTGNGKNAETGVVLDSLSFRQIFRASFAAGLPVMIAVFIAAILISIAVIGSFKGLF